MNPLNERSQARLLTCDPDLQSIVVQAANVMPLTVLCGHRNKEYQNRAYSAGRSKLIFPRSKHNTNPSLAVDIAPLMAGHAGFIDWKDLIAFGRLGGVMTAIAHQNNIKIRWGGDWDGDGQTRDESFRDLVHFELVV